MHLVKSLLASYANNVGFVCWGEGIAIRSIPNTPMSFAIRHSLLQQEAALGLPFSASFLTGGSGSYERSDFMTSYLL